MIGVMLNIDTTLPFNERYRHALEQYLDNAKSLTYEMLEPLTRSAQQMNFLASHWLKVHRQTCQALESSLPSEKASNNDPAKAELSSYFLECCLIFWEQSTPDLDLHRLQQEIHRRELIEETLRQQEERFHKISRNIPGMLFQAKQSDDGQIFTTYASCRSREILEVEPESLLEFAIASQNIWPADREALILALQKASADLSPLKWEGRYTTQSGIVKWLQILAQPSPLEPNEILWDGVLFDISDRKHSEAEQIKQSQKYQNLVANVPGVIFRVSIEEENWPMEYISQSITDLTGYSVSHFVGNNIALLDELIVPDDLLMVTTTIDTALELQQPYQIEYRLNTAHQGTRWILERGRGDWESDQTRHYLDGVLIDITDFKNTEDKLIQSLAEQNVLLREVHHRVKNNLNMVHSMLDMQSRQAPEQSVKAALLDSQRRLQTMALIHEQLYRAEHLSQVDMADYLSRLAQSFFNLSKGNPAVQLEQHLTAMMIDLDTAIPVGLIVNEVMTNALKHAFPGNRPGIIRLTLQLAALPGQSQQQIHLTISDNGIGFPSGFDPWKQTTLGLRLIKILATQIKADLDIQSTPNQATSFSIKFIPKIKGEAYVVQSGQSIPSPSSEMRI
jgi:PAS domain S-box-containing protein